MNKHEHCIGNTEGTKKTKHIAARNGQTAKPIKNPCRRHCNKKHVKQMHIAANCGQTAKTIKRRCTEPDKLQIKRLCI